MDTSIPTAQAPSLRPSAALPAFKSDAHRDRYFSAYDAVLGDWPTPCAELDIRTRLGTTHVVASGPEDAPPLLLLPSFAGTATAWRLNAAGLNRHYRTYAVDVVGQSGKGWADRPLRNRHDYADWLADLLDGLGIRRASLVGCSFGAFLAMNQALSTPGRVERIVMISPVGVFASQFWTLTFRARIKRPLVKLLRRLSRSGKAASMADLGIRPRDAKWATLMAVTMASTAKVSVITPTVFGRRQLRGLRAPALLLIGDREQLYDPSAMLALARKRMPALEGAIVADADHIAAMAQPEDVNERILRFLRASTAQG
ncbi:alpha/beta fold hydrolase [Luteimonas aquatica]|uniref:alpha/beta fold hydrolase n=1 Tax=Luteimonas aquatica TaxID=450364 RepID=UPI001F5604AE|nr:alpha/beta fold hydrolase [Luteimonas aquatica]